MDIKDMEKIYNKNKNKEYKIKGTIGKGGQGIIVLGQDGQDTKTTTNYAIKIINRDLNNITSVINREKNQNEFNSETESKRVVKVIDNFDYKNNYYIIMEYLSNGSLQKLIEHRKKLSIPFTEYEVQYYSTQIIQGLYFLHSKYIVHGDIKPSNLLLDENFCVKISDFGLSIKVEKNSEIINKFGTKEYYPPEMLSKEVKIKGKDLNKIDIWSLGVTIYQLLTGKLPFHGDNDKMTENFIINKKYLKPENISKVAQDLIKQIFQDAKDRPDIKQLLYHDFFHIGKIPKQILWNKNFDKNDEIRLKDPKNGPNPDEKKLIEKIWNEKIIDDVKNICLKNCGLNIEKDLEIFKIEQFVQEKFDDSIFKNRIKYFHKSSKHDLGFFIMKNNDITGIIRKNENNLLENIILNLKTKIIYIIKINNDKKEKDEIDSYKLDSNIPFNGKLKEKIDFFCKYHNKIAERKIEIKLIEENYSIKNDSNQINGENNQENNPIIYVKNWFAEKYGNFITFSDGLKQIIFNDKTFIYISPLTSFFGYVNQKDELLIFKNTEVNETFIKIDKQLLKKVKYIVHCLKKQLEQKLYDNYQKYQKEQEQYNFFFENLIFKK